MTDQNGLLKLEEILSSTFDELRAAGDTTTLDELGATNGD